MFSGPKRSHKLRASASFVDAVSSKIYVVASHPVPGFDERHRGFKKKNKCFRVQNGAIHCVLRRASSMLFRSKYTLSHPTWCRVLTSVTGLKKKNKCFWVKNGAINCGLRRALTMLILRRRTRADGPKSMRL